MSDLLIEGAIRVTTPDGGQHTLTMTNDPAELSYAVAAELTARIGESLDHTEQLIAQAFVGRAWKALGFASWDSWVDQHFGDCPMLVLRRADRTETVLSLSAAGLSNRAIGRAIGVHERTIRRELDGSGAANAAPGGRIGTDGKTYPSPAPRPDPLCDICGITGHESDDCPELDAELFQPIRAIHADDGPADIDFEQQFGPGPTPTDVIARQRVRRIHGLIKRTVVIRDDLEELPALLTAAADDLAGWPDSEVTPPAAWADDLSTQLDAIEEMAGEFTRCVQQGRAIVGALRVATR